MQFLKQSTASQIIMIGPFLEDTSGVLPQNGLTINNSDIKLNKHSSATFGNKNSGGGTNVTNGYYQSTLDATDTNTAGRLLLAINIANCLPVWHEFTVLPASSWDAIIAASGAGIPSFIHGYNTNQAPLQPTTAGRTLDVSVGGEAGIDWANVGSPTTTVNLSGTTVKTATDVETDTADIQTRLPSALTGGRIDASVGAMEANVITASAIATDAIDASEIAAGAVSEIQSGLSTLTESAVRDAIGLATANLDTQLSTLSDFVDTLEDGINVTQIAGSSVAATNVKNFWAGVETGTAQVGDDTEITLQSNESATNDFYNNSYITILSGTGVGQTRRITDYVGSTKVATVDTAWSTNPSSDSVYQIFGRN